MPLPLESTKFIFYMQVLRSKHSVLHKAKFNFLWNLFNLSINSIIKLKFNCPNHLKFLNYSLILIF